MNLIALLIVIESVPLFSAQTLVTHYALRVSKKICAIFDAIEIQAFLQYEFESSYILPNTAHSSLNSPSTRSQTISGFI